MISLFLRYFNRQVAKDGTCQRAFYVKNGKPPN